MVGTKERRWCMHGELIKSFPWLIVRDMLTRFSIFQVKETNRPEELFLLNMQGVFIVLTFGCIVGIIYGCIEKSVITFREAKERGVSNWHRMTCPMSIHKPTSPSIRIQQVSFRTEFISELRFLFKDVKPIRQNLPLSDGSLRSNCS